MKIAYIASGFPPAIGGLETFNAEVAQRLAGLGHEINLVHWVQPSEKANGWPFPLHNLLLGEDGNSYPCQEIPGLLQTMKPDVAVISRTTRRFRELPAILEEQGIPYVAICHGLRSRHTRRDWIRRYFSRRRFGFDRAAFVMAVSEYLASQLETMGVDPGRLRVLHPGVDSDRFRPDSRLRNEYREKLKLGDSKVMLTVSRLADWKGHDRVLRLMPKWLQTEPSLIYLIVGDGLYRASLQTLARELGLESHVRFVGQVSDPAPFFAVADLFAHPSGRSGKIVEAFGISILEAASSGLPIVASSETGASSIVVHDETGFLVGEGDDEALYNSVHRLLQDRGLRQRLGEAGRNRAIKQYTWNQCAQKLESSLREILGGKKLAAPDFKSRAVVRA